VVGLRLRKARVRILKRHCRVGKVTRKTSSLRMKGRVLSQRPKASRKKRPNGFRVRLTVGKGP
jgi:beta-lactam-binding protein with PASTA domain